VVVAGRRFGKSYLSAIELFNYAVNNPGSESWYVAPTYRMAKMIQWPQLKSIIPKHYFKKIHEQELSIELINGSKILLKGCDNPDSLRGASISFIVLDEFQDISMDAWTMVLMPACSDQRAPALFIGTPKGFNHFYDLYLKGGIDNGWASFQFTTAEGGNVDEEELSMAKHNMSPRQYAQEFLASFETLSNRIFYAFDRQTHLSSDDWDGVRPLHIGLDFNVAIMAGIVCYIDEWENIRIFDEIALENSYTIEVAEMLASRYKGVPINIYPDPSGKSRTSNAIGGLSDHKILEGFGYNIIAPKRALNNADGFANVNMAFMNAGSIVSMTVHPRCKHVIKSCEGWTYKKNVEVPDKESGLDHHGDAIKYLVNELKPVITNRAHMAKVKGF
jgi:hypothetical protein